MFFFGQVGYTGNSGSEAKDSATCVLVEVDDSELSSASGISSCQSTAPDGSREVEDDKLTFAN